MIGGNPWTSTLKSAAKQWSKHQAKTDKKMTNAAREERTADTESTPEHTHTPMTDTHEREKEKSEQKREEREENRVEGEREENRVEGDRVREETGNENKDGQTNICEIFNVHDGTFSPGLPNSAFAKFLMTMKPPKQSQFPQGGFGSPSICPASAKFPAIFFGTDRVTFTCTKRDGTETVYSQIPRGRKENSPAVLIKNDSYDNFIQVDKGQRIGSLLLPAVKMLPVLNSPQREQGAGGQAMRQSLPSSFSS